MKVYALPKELEATLPVLHDYLNGTLEQWNKAESDHTESIRTWLSDKGYTGKNAGKIFQTPVADGYARYMLAEGPGMKSFLLHLPYGDAYHDPDTQYLPKKEILERIAGRERINKLFGG